MKKFGPGILITAAFIGPGTITVCTLAGIHTGYRLLWVMVLSVFSTIVFQEMSARLGLISGNGLSAAIKREVRPAMLRFGSFFLIVSAILIGNTAYEAGNIAGAVLGLKTLFQNDSGGFNCLNLWIGALAFGLLLSGRYKMLEGTLTAVVLLMVVCFLSTALIIRPPLMPLLKGMFIPSVPDGKLLLAVAIIGTTVVPYNLFLHAAAVKEKWNGVQNLRAVRRDNMAAVIIGGLISAAVIITAASSATQIGEVAGAADLARGIEPVFGAFAQYAVALGLAAAGLSSAITAPLAAAYAISELFDNHTRIFKITWALVILIGTFLSAMDYSPVIIIRFAQITNGLLLPVMALFLMKMVNKKAIMGSYVNSATQNVLGYMVLAVTVILAIRTFINLFS